MQRFNLYSAVIISFLFSILAVQAQLSPDLGIASKVNNNGPYYNPALIPMFEGTYINLQYMSYNLGFINSGINSGHLLIFHSRAGLGFSLHYRSFSTSVLNKSVYSFALSRQVLSRLSLFLKPNYYYNAFQKQNFVYSEGDNPNDPVFFNGYATSSFGLDFGCYSQLGPRLGLGISACNLIKGSTGFIDKSGSFEDGYLLTGAELHIGYGIDAWLDSRYYIQTDQRSFLSFGGGLRKSLYEGQFYLQSGFFSEQIALGGGAFFSIGIPVRFDYSYTCSINELGRETAGTHGLAISFQLGSEKLLSTSSEHDREVFAKPERVILEYKGEPLRFTRVACREAWRLLPTCVYYINDQIIPDSKRYRQFNSSEFSRFQLSDISTLDMATELSELNILNLWGSQLANHPETELTISSYYLEYPRVIVNASGPDDSVAVNTSDSVMLIDPISIYSNSTRENPRTKAGREQLTKRLEWLRRYWSQTCGIDISRIKTELLSISAQNISQARRLTERVTIQSQKPRWNWLNISTGDTSARIDQSLIFSFSHLDSLGRQISHEKLKGLDWELIPILETGDTLPGTFYLDSLPGYCIFTPDSGYALDLENGSTISAQLITRFKDGALSSNIVPVVWDLSRITETLTILSLSGGLERDPNDDLEQICRSIIAYLNTLQPFTLSQISLDGIYSVNAERDRVEDALKHIQGCLESQGIATSAYRLHTFIDYGHDRSGSRQIVAAPSSGWVIELQLKRIKP